MKISEVLSAKAHSGTITIEPDASVRDLLAMLAEHNVGALVVSTDGASVAGIVSERDVARRLLEVEDLLTSPVSAIMTSLVASCAAEDDLDDLMRLMTERRIRHVPVVDGEQLVGVVSIGDVVKHRIDQLEIERDHLESYVHQM